MKSKKPTRKLFTSQQELRHDLRDPRAAGAISENPALLRKVINLVSEPLHDRTLREYQLLMRRLDDRTLAMFVSLHLFTEEGNGGFSPEKFFLLMDLGTLQRLTGILVAYVRAAFPGMVPLIVREIFRSALYATFMLLRSAAHQVRKFKEEGVEQDGKVAIRAFGVLIGLALESGFMPVPVLYARGKQDEIPEDDGRITKITDPRGERTLEPIPWPLSTQLDVASAEEVVAAIIENFRMPQPFLDLVARYDSQAALEKLAGEIADTCHAIQGLIDNRTIRRWIPREGLRISFSIKGIAGAEGGVEDAIITPVDGEVGPVQIVLAFSRHSIPWNEYYTFPSDSDDADDSVSEENNTSQMVLRALLLKTVLKTLYDMASKPSSKGCRSSKNGGKCGAIAETAYMPHFGRLPKGYKPSREAIDRAVMHWGLEPPEGMTFYMRPRIKDKVTLSKREPKSITVTV